jgi:O-antigen/teichoic acid export membrane protein
MVINHKKRFANNLVFYSLGTFATKLLQLLLIPLYSKYVSTTDLGTYNAILAVLFVAVPLLYQSIWEGAFRFAVESTDDERKVLALISKYCVGLTVIYSVIFIPVSYILDIQYGILILLSGIGQVGASYWQYAARALKENKLYAFSSVINAVVTVVLTVLLVAIFRWGLLALLIANSAGLLVMVLVLEFRLRLLRDVWRYPFNKLLFKQVVKYSLPLSINAISWWLMVSCNNIVVTVFLGSSANGIFAMALRFGSIFSTITSIVIAAWLEEAFRTFEDANRDAYFNQVLKILTKALLCIVLMLIPSTFIIYKYAVFGDYKEGVALVPIIYLYAAYNALACHLGSSFLARKESNIMFLTTLGGGIFVVVCSVIFIRIWGLMGVVYASLLGNIFTFFIRIPLLRKKINLHINFYYLTGLTVLCLAVAKISEYKPDNVTFQGFLIFTTGIFSVLLNRNLLTMIFLKIKAKFINK